MLWQKHKNCRQKRTHLKKKTKAKKNSFKKEKKKILQFVCVLLIPKVAIITPIASKFAHQE